MMIDEEPDEVLTEEAVDEHVVGIGKTYEFVVAPKTAGMRLDLYLAGQFPDYSRSLMQRAIDGGTVSVNDANPKASYKIRVGDAIRMWLPEPVHGLPQPENIPLDILYEDEYLAVINKPFDMVVHPAKGNWGGTLANALAFHFSQLSRLNGEYRPGIVHRLDRDTSGAILVAKEERTHADLAYQFETRKIFKEYLAITTGVLDRDSDYIERRIGHHPHDRIKMIVTDDPERGKEACTFYEVIERFKGYTFCRLQPRTGRTHQIRVHLGSVGCPVLADKTYSGRDCFRLSDLSDAIGPQDDALLLVRQALHAFRLRFLHPRLRQVMAIEAPLPADLQATLQALRRFRAP